MALSQMWGLPRSRPSTQSHLNFVGDANAIATAHPLIGYIEMSMSDDSRSPDDLKTMLGSDFDPRMLWVERDINGANWAEALMAFVTVAQNSGQLNAVVSLNLDFTSQDAACNRSSCHEFTPLEMAALEHARQNQMLVVASTENGGDAMAALAQAAQQFDHLITVEPTGTITWAGRGSSISGPAVTTKTVTAAALVWMTNPALSYRQVIDILTTRATNRCVANPNRVTMMDWLTIGAAVRLAQTSVGETTPSRPRSQPPSWHSDAPHTSLERLPQGRYGLKAEDNLWAIAAREWGNVAVG